MNRSNKETYITYSKKKKSFIYTKRQKTKFDTIQPNSIQNK